MWCEEFPSGQGAITLYSLYIDVLGCQVDLKLDGLMALLCFDGSSMYHLWAVCT